MRLHFEPVTKENETEVLKLKTAKGQEGFVETVEECLSESKESGRWRPVCIYDGKKMVGFAMYGYFREYLPFGRVWLDRLLIDENCQGMGYGKAALEGLLQRLYKEYKQEKIYLSVVKENKTAIRLYSEHGFQFTGELDINGEKVMVLKNYRSPGMNV